MLKKFFWGYLWSLSGLWVQNLSILQCKVYETVQQIPVRSVMVMVAFCSARCMKQYNRFLSDLSWYWTTSKLSQSKPFFASWIRDGRFLVNYHRNEWKVPMLSFGTVFYYWHMKNCECLELKSMDSNERCIDLADQLAGRQPTRPEKAKNYILAIFLDFLNG